MEEVTVIEAGSGNVFADLGFPDAAEHQVKARLVLAISQALKAKKISQADAALLVGLDQPKISKLLRGDFRGYSSDRLMQILNLLGQDVIITIVPHSDDQTVPGRTNVALAS